MPNITVTKGRYIIDNPLYQWDLDQVLEIRGLSLPSIPEIHFTNDAMERAIVRHAEMDDAGVITVAIPNSLLQKPVPVIAYVCIYEGDTFETLYKIEIPLKARKQPLDYSFTDDQEEVYSFNALEHLVNTSLELYLAKYDEAMAKVEICQDISQECYESLLVKANVPSIIATTLYASKWAGKQYSFEEDYPIEDYDLEIALDNIASTGEKETFDQAQIVGSATANIIKAYGVTPTINIPIILKATLKGELSGNGVVMLTSDYTGTSEVSIENNGTEYDVDNMTANGETASNGDLIIDETEEN